MKEVKNVALVKHGNRKNDLVEWAQWNCQTLLNHNLICTGTTGLMIERVIRERLETENPDRSLRSITKLKSVPLGGISNWGP